MRIVLIGFMASGKTVVGKLLSKIMNIKFIDMDLEIENIEQKTITQIFQEEGEEYFRQKENEVLSDLIKLDNVVIATGGGVITRKENINILKQEKNTIFLDASVETIEKNVKHEIDKRPLLRDSENLYEAINNLLKIRYSKYEDACNIKIDTNNKNIDEVVSEILVIMR